VKTWLLTVLTSLGALVSPGHTEPIVTGYSRFHADAPSSEGGRLLFNELGCANCHVANTALPARKGPDIRGVTSRVHTDWLRRFLATPDATHQGSNMPSLLSQDAGDIEAVVHYLGSLKPSSTSKPKNPAHVNALRGEELFHTTGCVACHEPEKNFIPEDGLPDSSEHSHPSVKLPRISEKYSLASLTAFLVDPLRSRPDGRMPRISLEESEATDIAGYLLGFGGSDGKTAPTLEPFSAEMKLAKRGQDLVTKARCAACHELPKEVSSTTVALKKLNGGCLDEAPAADVPRYALNKNQRTALLKYLEEGTKSSSEAQRTLLTLQALNCSACHERDGIGGPDAARKAYFVGDKDLGDTGRYPPPLTGVGRKLQRDWLENVLAGTNRVRPYLKTRMPVYGGATAGLAELLEHADQRPAQPLPGGDDTAGRKLLGTQGGIGCITCHRWGERPSLGIQALDLSNLGQRLKPEWLFEYLVNPAAYRPGTLMPSFWPGGQSSNSTILDGDAARQIASIYSFAKSANGEPEGFPEIAGGQFELVPKERPIIQRTFLEGVGTHAILVGFPAGVHLAFDAGNGRPALLWSGRFFDAYTTWFSRFAPFEKPLGEKITRWAEPPSSAGDVWFEGYKLDRSGMPVFMYKIAGTHFEDRFEGLSSGMSRQISWVGDLHEPIITHPDGMTVQEELPATPGQRRFTYHWK